MFGLIKALEIKTSTLFHLDFASNPIFSCFFVFFIIINLYFLIPTVIAQIFNPIAELVLLIGISTKEEKAELKTHPLTAEITISK